MRWPGQLTFVALFNSEQSTLNFQQSLVVGKCASLTNAFAKNGNSHGRVDCCNAG